MPRPISYAVFCLQKKMEYCPSNKSRITVSRCVLSGPFFFFNHPATPEIYSLSLHDALPILRRDAVQPDIEAERKKRDEIEAGKSYCSRRFGGATCDDKSAQIYARFDKNDWRIQPAEFYR